MLAGAALLASEISTSCCIKYSLSGGYFTACANIPMALKANNTAPEMRVDLSIFYPSLRIDIRPLLRSHSRSAVRVHY
jgi:hypothetical protein